MRSKFNQVLCIVCCLVTLHVQAQSFSFSCTRDTIIPRCTQAPCFTLKARIPDIHAQSGSYTVNPIGETPNACFPIYTQPNSPSGTSANLLIDDFYSNVINLSFPFSFYGSVLNSLIVSPNGVVSFDISNAGQRTHFGILRDPLGLSATSGVPENLPSTLYDRSLIMGPYHDMNPQENTSPSRRVQYETIGVAPHRKWVLSFFMMPLYYNTGGCNQLIENTHQVVLYESTGIIEVLMFDKQPCTAWNEGRGMIGIQNNQRNQAVMVEGRKASDAPWGTPGMHEAYRFVPSGGASLFKRVELCDLAGNIIRTGTTVNLGNGKLEASFPNICPVVGSTLTYVVRSVYTKFDDPTVEIYGTDTVNITKSIDPDLHATAATTKTDCYTATGTITVNVPPGIADPPYHYQLDNGPILSNTTPFTFTNVGPGNHTVYITDPSGTCTSTIQVLIEKNNSLAVNPVATATACLNVATGTVTANMLNGVGPFIYQLDGNPFVVGASPQVFTGVNSGDHILTVMDATGCRTNIITVNVPVGPGSNGNITATTASSCTAVANATVTVAATAGVAPFTWQLDGGPLETGASPHTFINVLAGPHTVTIRDNIGCEKILPVTVLAGPGVNGTTSFTAASCQGISNGTITAMGTFGQAPFQFQLDGGSFQTGSNPYTFTGVSGGPHVVVIRDNTGCTHTMNVVVSSGPALTAALSAGATSCFGASNGTVTITPTNGTGPYRFSLDNGPYVNGAIPFTFTNVTAGPHAVKYMDAPGCVSNDFPVTVNPGPVITTTVSKTNALCNGSATGSIAIAMPALGAAPFQYSIDGITWQSGNTFNGLPAGSYTVYYRSANGCQGSQNVLITEPARLAATTVMVPVTCHGEPNGQFTITTTGGVGPYQYSIDGGVNWQNAATFIRPAGTYTVVIRDGNNCTNTIPVVITEPAPLTATSTNTNASCDGGNDGHIIVTAQGGNAGYQYSIDGINFQFSNNFAVAPGQYTVVIKDQLGCRMSFNTTVGLTVNLFLQPLADQTICNGTSIQLNAFSNASVYSWEPVTGLNNSHVANPTASPADTTRYVITATLGRCSTTDTLFVNVNKAPVPDAGPDGDICYGQSFTLHGSGGVQFEWSPPLYLNSTSVATPVSTPTKITVYHLSVIDAAGCRSLVTDEVKVVTSKPMRVYTFPFDTTARPGAQIPLLAISEGIQYHWTPATGLSNPSIANPVLTVGNVGEEMSYQVVATTAEGCKGEGYVKVRVYRGPDIYMPNAFTPNNDGKNDVFTPVPVGIASYNYFRVYNRWGQLLFSTQQLHSGWDGRLNGKEQAAGVYVWMIEGVTDGKTIIRKKGTVTLIR